jgi:hypothetical protein
MKFNRVMKILILLFLLCSENNYADSPFTQDNLKPGTASGKLSLNVQTFKMKYTYVTKTQEDDKSGAVYLVLVTNRKFPYDLSKLTRFEIGRYMERYDLYGIDFGFDDQQNLIFVDVLRAPNMIVAAQFEPAQRKQGQIAGRIYTEGEVRYFRNRVKFDIKFNAKL